MQLLPNPNRAGAYAIALLVVVVALIYFIGVHWWFTAPHFALAQEVSDLQDQELRFRQVAAERPQIEKGIAEVRAFEAGNPAFLPEADYDAAIAGLTQRLKQAIAMHAKDSDRCQSLLNAPVKNKDTEMFEKATIQVRIRCDNDEFGLILHDLETSNPLLFVEDLQIYKQSGYRAAGQTKVSSYLDIRFNLSGYLRNRVAKESK